MGIFTRLFFECDGESGAVGGEVGVVNVVLKDQVATMEGILRIVCGEAGGRKEEGGDDGSVGATFRESRCGQR